MNKCCDCGKEIEVRGRSIRCRTCSKRGKLHPSWRGGRTINNKHIVIRIDQKPFLEHHYVWIQHNQIPIPKGFVIHHLDCNSLNNNIKNLLLLDKNTHNTIHGLINYPKGSKFGINKGDL